MDLVPSPSKKKGNKEECPMCSAKHQDVQSKIWATSSCTNLSKQSEQLSVQRACDIPKKEQITACVVSVSCPRQNKQKESKIELASSQTLCTSSNSECDVWLHQGRCLLFLVRGSGVRNTEAFQPGRRLSACRVLWRFSAWCPTALVASALSQNGRSATSASLTQKQCPSCNLRGEALWWASRAVHLHIQEGSMGGDAHESLRPVSWGTTRQPMFNEVLPLAQHACSFAPRPF